MTSPNTCITPISLGARIDRKGDFTWFQFVKSFDRDELEDRCGFHKGRLRFGAAIAVITQESLASLSAASFELGASTRWSRSAAAAPWAPQSCIIRGGDKDGRMNSNAVEVKKANEGQDVNLLKARVVQFFNTKGDHLPAKVIPFWVDKDDCSYPNAIGAGIPQFKMLQPVKWEVVRLV